MSQLSSIKVILLPNFWTVVYVYVNMRYIYSYCEILALSFNVYMGLSTEVVQNVYYICLFKKTNYIYLVYKNQVHFYKRQYKEFM